MYCNSWLCPTLMVWVPDQVGHPAACQHQGAKRQIRMAAVLWSVAAPPYEYLPGFSASVHQQVCAALQHVAERQARGQCCRTHEWAVH